MGTNKEFCTVNPFQRCDARCSEGGLHWETPEVVILSLFNFCFLHFFVYHLKCEDRDRNTYLICWSVRTPGWCTQVQASTVHRLLLHYSSSSLRTRPASIPYHTANVPAHTQHTTAHSHSTHNIHTHIYSCFRRQTSQRTLRPWRPYEEGQGEKKIDGWAYTCGVCGVVEGSGSFRKQVCEEEVEVVL